MPVASMGGPMTIRMVPRRFKRPRRPHSSPALWATGTALQPARVARSAPESPHLRSSPRLVRVPSGKMSTHMPSLRRATPCSTTCITARLPALRLMAMGFMSQAAWPTNGIQRISRFNTQACGGNTSVCATVSQLLLCFQKVTCAPSVGIFSRPSTTQSKPHSHLPRCNTVQPQARAMS